jgi:hypothetical protein
MGGINGVGQKPIGHGIQRVVVPLPQLGQRVGVTAGDTPHQVAIGGLVARFQLERHPGLKTP